ncbi:hypothetical protein COO60DRAFT_601636 [Scenedesmus sp. NREL 46B-D3]|nr:hypothetical protein COO60DRAFT_601636 [Scenedesmus sp. NREL 46B-D3]
MPSLTVYHVTLEHALSCNPSPRPCLLPLGHTFHYSHRGKQVSAILVANISQHTISYNWFSFTTRSNNNRMRYGQIHAYATAWSESVADTCSAKDTGPYKNLRKGANSNNRGMVYEWRPSQQKPHAAHSAWPRGTGLEEKQEKELLCPLHLRATYRKYSAYPAAANHNSSTKTHSRHSLTTIHELWPKRFDTICWLIVSIKIWTSKSGCVVSRGNCTGVTVQCRPHLPGHLPLALVFTLQTATTVRADCCSTCIHALHTTLQQNHRRCWSSHNTKSTPLISV